MKSARRGDDNIFEKKFIQSRSHELVTQLQSHLKNTIFVFSMTSRIRFVSMLLNYHKNMFIHAQIEVLMNVQIMM